MANATIKHFIFIQFFSYKRNGYPYDVLDVDFLSKQLPLTKNALRSLENQSNKNFEIVFVMNNKFFSDKKYDLIFSTLRDSTTLPIKFMKSEEEIPLAGDEVPYLITDALNEYDFVIQSRLDFDDFIFKDAIADTQAKVDDCDSILYYGYCKGYEYFCLNGELYPNFNTWNGLGHIGILQSVILSSPFGRKFPFFSRYALNHGKVKLVIKKFLEKNGVAFAENMVQQNTTTNAYIYFRHEYSQEQLVKKGNSNFRLPRQSPLTTADITKKQLEEELGFFYELNSIK